MDSRPVLPGLCSHYKRHAEESNFLSRRRGLLRTAAACDRYPNLIISTPVRHGSVV